jgi:hypothetical protein
MQPPLTITTYTGTAQEEHGRRQLQRLLETYDVERWLYTRKVVIRSFINPHSHPVLTLNTRQLDCDEGQLGTFLHEQFHWYAVSKRAQVEAAISDFRSMIPVVPTQEPEAAKDEYSTYLHLIICNLELDALRQLLGEDRALDVISARPYYKWVYRQVLDDDGPIRDVIERHRLALP